MEASKELLTALYYQDKSILSKEFMYSEEGYTAARKLASEFGVDRINNEPFYAFLDRIFAKYAFISSIKKNTIRMA